MNLNLELELESVSAEDYAEAIYRLDSLLAELKAKYPGIKAELKIYNLDSI